MKKILFQNYPLEYYTGGAEYQVKLLEKSIENDNEIRYLFMHPAPADRSKYLTYSFRRTGTPINMIKELVILFKLIKEYAPHIIYKRGLDYTAAASALYARKNKIKMILHIASDKILWKMKYPLRLKSIFAFVENILARYSVQNADIVVSQSNHQKQRIFSKYKKDSVMIRNYHPLPNGTSLKCNPIKVVWVANYKQLKQPDLFIKLSELIDIPNVEVIMAGRLPVTEDGKVVKYISSNSSLRILGELSPEEINKLLEKSHILVNTSVYEGFPNTFIQAWLRGVVVVSLNVDPDNILENEKIGYRSGTFHQLVKDVKLLITDEALRTELSLKSILVAKKMFDMDTNIKKVIELLK